MDQQELDEVDLVLDMMYGQACCHMERFNTTVIGLINKSCRFRSLDSRFLLSESLFNKSLDSCHITFTDSFMDSSPCINVPMTVLCRTQRHRRPGKTVER